MGRTALALLIANAVTIASWLLLRTIWFDGTMACDQVVGPDYDQCNDRADLLVALGISALTLLTGTLLTAAVQATARLRTARRGDSATR